MWIIIIIRFLFFPIVLSALYERSIQTDCHSDYPFRNGTAQVNLCTVRGCRHQERDAGIRRNDRTTKINRRMALLLWGKPTLFDEIKHRQTRNEVADVVNGAYDRKIKKAMTGHSKVIISSIQGQGISSKL